MAPRAKALQWSSLSILAISLTQVLAIPAAIVKRAEVDESQLPTGWSYKGCYVDGAAGRALTGATYASDDAMTEQACAIFCDTAGYKYAGVEYSVECFCGHTLTAAVASEASCSMTCSGDADQLCGGPNRLNVFETAALTGPQVNPGPGEWGTMGCYTDPAGGRTLAVQVDTAGGVAALTIELCVNACEAAGYELAGAEYGGECFCANEFTNGGEPAPDGAAQCNMPCNGNRNELCGGPYRLNVYGLGAPKPTVPGSTVTSSTTSRPPTTTPVPPTTTTRPPSTSSTSTSTQVQPSDQPGWNDIGCYTDTVAVRSLPVGMAVPGGPDAVTPEVCQAACRAAGYVLAGVEYSYQCFCGNALAAGAQPATSGCNMPCSGDATKICGGPDRLNVYRYGASTTTVVPPTTTPVPPTTTTRPPSSSSTSTQVRPSDQPGWNDIGCYTDTVAVRSLPVGMAVPGGPDAVTPEVCQAACRAAGYVLAGVEYSYQCFCGNALAAGAQPATSGCNMPCSGDATKICGGPDRLNVYRWQVGTTTVVPPSSTSRPPTTTPPVPPTTTTTRPPTSTSSGTGSSTGLPAGWTYKGCWNDGRQGRIMLGPFVDNVPMTVELCVNACADRGYKIAGLQYMYQCFCDNQLRNAATLADSDSQCAMACSGAPSQICGGPNLNSIYSIGELVVIQPASSQVEDLPGQWVYKGCLIDLPPARPLPEQIIFTTDNDATTCLSACSKFGYNAGGLEYGVECYCGDISGKDEVGAEFVPEAQCNTPCPGDARYTCGAGNRLSYYEWEGIPINVYGYPTGAGLGEFVLMGDGPVVPLITTLGINGKVTFVEKAGTSTTPGSTGAYEWDPETNTFRTMHVKTDVFCSAGLTLPDRLGRQLNIGGWSGDSLYGVRLYTPDGSPGAPSINDWEENFQTLALQKGRWYPTGLIMANGSILVVGGEDGSNGPPVPNLEVLPRRGGIVECEWLERTDPYNLYPFLAVLPSTGDIFVAYYNEARILNQVNFDTIRQLPDMPGAVNNPLAGRTYPLEGTMMLLPQSAPYTAPLGVLLCGGSTPFGGHALDNCVSTTPEVAGAEWTIEKMPSKRVMSCMTALPDGTYLIVNGAKEGVAGFGLASDANHNAVLYDPSKEVGRRMSLLANSTIDRYYHSESILLQDGSVLISGSDPETPGLLQETRIEIFKPPYLLRGPAPAFTITDRDWAHGSTAQVTITLRAAGTVKFSLMGIESSTHGNSMGQRTIFPAFTCAGTTCTITAPPNANVCPPGWFQLFLLENGVPSQSAFVRIGGDPGNLGAWPAGLEDFVPPGPGPVV